MTNKKKESKTGNPWNNEKNAMEILKKNYPDLPEPHLLRCYKVYMHQKKLNEQERKAFMKHIEKQDNSFTIKDLTNATIDYKDSIELFDKEKTEAYLLEHPAPKNEIIPDNLTLNESSTDFKKNDNGLTLIEE